MNMYFVILIPASDKLEYVPKGRSESILQSADDFMANLIPPSRNGIELEEEAKKAQKEVTAYQKTLSGDELKACNEALDLIKDTITKVTLTIQNYQAVKH